jgi:hypothetical protein
LKGTNTMQSFWVLNLEPLTVQTLLTILIVVTLFGALLAFSYYITHRKEGYDQSLLFTLLIMPLVVSIIVLLVSNNLARAFSLAGVFTLVRFRLAMSDASDLAYILASVGIGLALALGYVLLGMIITLFLAIVLTFLSHFILKKESPYAKLIFMINEELNIKGTLEDILKTHTSAYKLDRIKSQSSGTQYKLSYRIKLKKEFDAKQLIDAIKQVNGALDISIQEDYHTSYEEKL